MTTPTPPAAPLGSGGEWAGEPDVEAWPPGRIVGSLLGAGLVTLVVGALYGRPDIAVLGVAPVLSAAWHLLRRPTGELGVETSAAPSGEPGALTSALVLRAPAHTHAVRLRLVRANAQTTALVRAEAVRTLRVSLPSVRTGSQELFAVDAAGVGAGAATDGPAQHEAAARVLVLPRPRSLADSSQVALPPRLRGHSGAHESRRPGDGGGLRDIHPYAPGDSLRRVDWRVTARRSPDVTQLYVRRTYALAEAVVTLVVDSRDDVGPDPMTWHGDLPPRADVMTSLDLAREGAATLAQAYLGSGDRVSLDDLGARRRPVPAGAGRRQLDRVVHRLALLRPDGQPAARLRPPQVPSGALIYVFATFLDAEPVRTALLWRRSGHRVIAVDVLPPLVVDHLSPHDALALRMVRIERADRLAELAAAGVELIAWSRGRGNDRALAMLARRSHHRPAGRAQAAR